MLVLGQYLNNRHSQWTFPRPQPLTAVPEALLVDDQLVDLVGPHLEPQNLVLLIC